MKPNFKAWSDSRLSCYYYSTRDEDAMQELESRERVCKFNPEEVDNILDLCEEIEKRKDANALTA